MNDKAGVPCETRHTTWWQTQVSPELGSTGFVQSLFLQPKHQAFNMRSKTFSPSYVGHFNLAHSPLSLFPFFNKFPLMLAHLSSPIPGFASTMGQDKCLGPKSLDVQPAFHEVLMA